MKLALLSLVVALQIGWLGATIHRQERILEYGEVVHLDTRPVDPRDLLRGDYVILTYEISVLNTNLFDPSSIPLLQSEQAVYVELAFDGEFHRPVRAAIQRFDPAEGHTRIRGTLSRLHSPNPREVRVRYGIERFYVREGTGNPTGHLTVHAAVNPRGHMLIRDVLIDGTPYAEAMRDTQP